MKPVTNIKCGTVFLFLIVSLLLLGSIFAYWRNQYLKSGNGIVDSFLSIIPVQRYGIIGNCKYSLFGDCALRENTGFVGDTAIIVMISFAAVIFAINALVISISTTNGFPQAALYLLPLTSAVGSVLMIACLIIFLIYYKTMYEYSEVLKRYEHFELNYFTVDYMTPPRPAGISYGDGFYLLIASLIFGLFAIPASGYAAFKAVAEGNQLKAQKAGYVVQQKIVKKQVIETPEVEEEQDIERAVERKQVKKAPIKKNNNKTQSQQSEVKVDDDDDE